ncbi:DsbA family protein [Pseudomonadales bacterium]|nr:DsbA family protein [Pseudomonadales bacterium]
MSIAPHLTRLITSQWLRNFKRSIKERQRRRAGQPHKVTVYLRLNDPYSYVLLQVLDQFAARYAVEFEFRTILNLQPQMYPAPELWENNAFHDGAYLANLYGLDFPDTRPERDFKRDAGLTAQLLHWELQPGYAEHALPLFEAYWQDDQAKLSKLVDSGITEHAECYQHHLAANEAHLKSNGHYLSAMLHYGGEWYWGLDRLAHLERRLNDLRLAAGAAAEIQYDRGYRDFCRPLSTGTNSGTDADTPITLYWSFRSPYSYIGLVRAKQLATHYQLPLEVKPVLPMVMRRMQVPRTKGFYILQDAKREATQYGIEFGKIADPLGAGVERCYALYEFAVSAGKGLEFLESCARGAWAEGINAATDTGLQLLVERAGLDWQQARLLLTEDGWRIWAQRNLADMYSEDLWGVPSLSYRDTKVYGQDRIECIEQAIRYARKVEEV